MQTPNSKRLLPDGGYGANINGYSEHNAIGKQYFLRNARSLLKETGRRLAARGLTEVEIHINEGGIAVSGEVMARYWSPESPERRVYASIGASALGWGRKDQLIILARIETYAFTSARVGRNCWRPSRLGENEWLSANFDTAELAERLWAIYAPATSPVGMTAFTHGGSCAIPDPLAQTAIEAATHATAMACVEQLFAEDNTPSQSAAPAQMGLLDQGDEQEATVAVPFPTSPCPGRQVHHKENPKHADQQ